MSPEQRRIIEALLMKQAGMSGDPMGGMKRAGMSAPPGSPKNMGSGGAPAPGWRDSAEREYANKGGFSLTKEQKRADMSGLTPDARQQYLRQSFVAPGLYPDRGANGGPGGGIEMLRQLYMQQSRPIWFQNAINNGDYSPDELAAIMKAMGQSR